MSDLAPFNPAFHRGLLQMIKEQPYTHGLTLNADREMNTERIESIFKTFCALIDREMHGVQRVKNIPTNVRLNAIAFPEHLTTNAHLHALADLSCLEDRCKDAVKFSRIIYVSWRKASRGAGSTDVQRLTSDGFGKYAAKGARSTDPVYWLARQFHPN
jgi:hypothetical protein